MRLRGRPFLSLLLLGAALLARAQTPAPAPHGVTRRDDARSCLEAGVSIPGINVAGDKISGTNVNIGVVVMAFRKNGATDPWTDIQLTSGKLECLANGTTTEFSVAVAPPVQSALVLPGEPGGPTDGELFASLEPVPTPPTTSQTTPGGGGGGPNQTWLGYAQTMAIPGARFASTHFADGTAVTLKVTATFAFYKTVGGTRTYDHSETITTQIVPECYNKLQTLGTTVLSNGDTDPTFTFPEASSKMASSATTALQSSHPSAPGSWPMYETRTSIMSRLESSTVFSGLCHGTLAHFGDSDYSENVSFQLDVGDVVSNRDVPSFNLVGFWACSTLNPTAPSMSASATSFGVVGQVDRGYAGFRAKVSAALWPASSWSNGGPGQSEEPPNDLGDHAYEFWTEILNGKTIELSLLEANAQYPPVRPTAWPYTIEEMILVGDPRANLINVYLNQNEFDSRYNNNLPTNIWWIKL